MSDYEDEDGNPLGRWVPCTEDEYVAEVYRGEGRESLTVFASLTEVGRETYTFPEPRSYVDRHIYTEWGERTADVPLVSCDDRWDAWGKREHVHMRFIPIDAPVGVVRG